MKRCQRDEGDEDEEPEMDDDKFSNTLLEWIDRFKSSPIEEVCEVISKEGFTNTLDPYERCLTVCYHNQIE